MELRHMRHFIAVAEELHFARAAKRLKIAQPPLSQSIKRLEESLGTRLLERSSRGVQLTTSGQALLPEAREILAHAQLAEQLVRRVAGGEPAQLRVGFVPLPAMQRLPIAVRQFQRRWPKVELQLQEMTSAAQVEALRAGQIDVGIVTRDRVDTYGLQAQSLERYNWVLAVPAAWPLASRPSLRLADLAGSPLLLFPRKLFPGFLTELETACRAAGFVPRANVRVAEPHTMLALVAHEVGIGFVPETARRLKVEGVRLVPVLDLPTTLAMQAAVAWVPRAQPKALRELIDLLQSREP